MNLFNKGSRSGKDMNETKLRKNIQDTDLKVGKTRKIGEQKQLDNYRKSELIDKIEARKNERQRLRERDRKLKTRIIPESLKKANKQIKTDDSEISPLI